MNLYWLHNFAIGLGSIFFAKLSICTVCVFVLSFVFTPGYFSSIPFKALLSLSPLYMSHNILPSFSLLCSSNSLHFQKWSNSQFSFHPVFKTLDFNPEYHFLRFIFPPLDSLFPQFTLSIQFSPCQEVVNLSTFCCSYHLLLSKSKSGQTVRLITFSPPLFFPMESFHLLLSK